MCTGCRKHKFLCRTKQYTGASSGIGLEYAHQFAEKGHNIVVVSERKADILVNNAGMLIFSKLEHTVEERIDKIIALHCTAPTKLCRLFADDMARRGRGHILNMSSVTA